MTRDEAIVMIVNATYGEEWQGDEKLTLANHMAIEALKEPDRVRGHWEEVSRYGEIRSAICECSICKDTVWIYDDTPKEWNYCPNCGAKMDLGE